MRTLLDGEKIFKLMDTTGLPLEIINKELRTHDASFNVIEFVEAAIESKNFTYSGIKVRLLSSMREKDKQGFLDELDKVAQLKDWIK